MMNDKYEYIIHVWGGLFNEEFKKLHKREPGYFWFDTEPERKDFWDKLHDLAKKHDTIVTRTEAEGTDTRFQWIAKMVFEYKGKQYPYSFNFGYIYSADGASYMFNDGNYSCDCNKSLFIRRKYGAVIPELECGDEITMTNFEVVRERDFRE